MLFNITLLIFGFIILTKGADLFVDGTSGIAENLRLPKMLIGLTIVAFGTSVPEFAVSIKSILSQRKDIVLGNVIGSNIINTLLILGSSAIIHSLIVKKNTIKKEMPIHLLISTVFAVLLSDNMFDKEIQSTFTRADGIVLILFFLIFFYYIITTFRKNSELEMIKEIISLKNALLYTIIGLVAIVLGSNFVVDTASYIATNIGVSERIIALTIIALGTSLPELVTSITATKKGEYDIAIGNILGSNLFNIGIVIGVPVALFGGISQVSIKKIDLVIMLLSSILLLIFSIDKKISKKEGIIFLILFITYYSYILIS